MSLRQSPCLSTALSAIGCAVTDLACACGPVQGDFPPEAVACIVAGCQVSDLNTALTAIQSVCSVYSAGITGSNTPTRTSGGATTGRTTSARTSATPRNTGAGSDPTNTTPVVPGDGTGSPGGGGGSAPLAPGAIAGIAVGAIFGAGLLAVGAFLLGRRQKRASRAGASGAAADPPPGAGPKTEAVADAAAYKSGAELDGAPRVEMEAPRGGELEGIHGHPTYVYPTNAYPTHAHQMPQELDAQPRSYPTR